MVVGAGAGQSQSQTAGTAHATRGARAGEGTAERSRVHVAVAPGASSGLLLLAQWRRADLEDDGGAIGHTDDTGYGP